MKQYLKNTWEGIWTVLVGMKITWRHLFTPAVTIQYPELKVPIPERARNRIFVDMNDCIGCKLCSKACPVNCIDISTVKGLPTEDLGVTSNGKKKSLWVTNFKIDFSKCCFCSLCVWDCPTGCIQMTPTYEYSEYNKEDLVYKFSVLTEDEIAEKTRNFDKFAEERSALNPNKSCKKN